MSADRISRKQQKIVFLNAFEEALENLEDTHPGKMWQAQQTLGPEWVQETERLVEENLEVKRKTAREREQGEPGQAVPSEPDRERTVDAGETVPDHGKSKNDGWGSPTDAIRRGPTPQLTADVPTTAPSTSEDERRRQAEKIEKMSDTMAKDMLDSIQSGEGGTPEQRAFKSMRTWRNKTGALSVLHAGREQERELLLIRDPDLIDRARKVQEVDTSVSVEFDPNQSDALYAMAYVRSLEKVAATEPAYEGFVHSMVQRENASPENWREHEYQNAMRCGFTGKDQTTHQQRLEEVGLEPVTLLNGALWTAGLARVLDASLRYTVDKTSREILFLPLPADLSVGSHAAKVTATAPHGRDGAPASRS